MPAEFFTNTTSDVLAKLESIALKRSLLNKGRNAEERLVANQEAVQPLAVEAGSCDRQLGLHKFRFAAPVICTAQEEWLQARAALGPTGLPPLACYDMAAIGLAGCVTSRGWIELHNPGSQALQLKLFSMANVANRVTATRRLNLAANEDTLEVGDSLKEVADLQEFQRALRTIREALHWVMPWNKTVAAIEGFLAGSNFMARELGEGPSKAATLTAFVDHCFALNAERWRARQGFLTVLELASLWTVWYSSRASSFQRGSSGQPHHTQQTKAAKKKAPPQVPKQRTQGQLANLNPDPSLCRRFNMGACPNQAAACKTMAGQQLRHFCNFRDPATGATCSAAHPRTGNH